MQAEDLVRLSALLDRVIDLEVDQRAKVLDSLEGDQRALGQVLRRAFTQAAFGTARGRLEPDAVLSEAALRAAANSEHALEAGSNVGPYRLVRELGAGGMGEVWLAERADGQFARQVALKLPVLASRRTALLERFAREREILAGLEHPHIARLYDAGVTEDGQPYLALEFVDGQPIDSWCRERALPTVERVRLLLQVADAVAYAHSRLVLHRDLKPGNVFVTRQGQVRLLDFGIAKLMGGPEAAAESTDLTQRSGRAFSRDFASPEQIAGQPLGTASDVYSLAVLAYLVLTDVPAYRLKRASAAELEEAILVADVLAPSSAASDPSATSALRGDLDAILMRALRKAPSERYASVEALAQDLRRHLNGQRVQARPDTLRYRAARFARRHRWPLGGGSAVAIFLVLALGAGATVLVLCALTVGLAVALWQTRRAMAHARRAEMQARTAHAVQRFMLDIFAVNRADQVDPMVARALTARELLDRGAARIDKALADVPEACLQALEMLARMYEDLSHYQVAAGLHRKRIAVLGGLEGELDDSRETRIAQAWLDLAEAEGQRSDLPAASHAAEAAVAILQRRGDNTSALWGRALDAQAMLSVLRDAPDALDRSTRAVQVLRRHAVSRELVSALHMLSHTLSAAGRSDEALEVIEEGLRDAASLGEQGLALTDELNRAWARVQIERGEVLQGEARQRAMLAACMERHGTGSLITLIAAAELGGSLFHRGEVLQADVVLRPLAEAAQQRVDQGESDWVSPLVLGFYAAARAALGDMAGGAAIFERLQISAAGPGDFPRPVVWNYLARMRAEVCTWLGEYETAKTLLQVASQQECQSRVGSAQSERHWATELMLARAIGDSAGLANLAERVRSLDAAAQAGRPPPLERWPLRAEIAEALGDSRQAMDMALEGLERIEAQRPRLHRADLECRLRAVLGISLHADGRFDEAVTQLRAAVELLTGRLDAECSPQAVALNSRLIAVLSDMKAHHGLVGSP